MKSPQPAMLTVSWRTTAIASLVIALGAVVVASVVSSVRDADVLSVVALALAIIAFVIQIITFVLQTAGAAAQERRAEEIYGETRATLRAIEEKTEGTRRAMDGLNGTLLEAALGKAIPEARAAATDLNSEESLVRDIADRAAEIVRSSQASDEGKVPHLDRASPRPRVLQDLRSSRPTSKQDEYMLQHMPSSEEAVVARSIDGLEPTAIRALRWLAEDQLAFGASEGIGPGMSSVSSDAVKALGDRGLIRRRRAPWSTKPIFYLTDEGKMAGRLFTQRNPSPGLEVLQKALDTIREGDERLRQYEESEEAARSAVPFDDE